MTSWVAVGIIGMIGTITLIHVFIWFAGINRRRHGSVDLNPPLVDHDQLGGDDHLRNVLNSSYDDDDDDKPLHP